MSGPIRCRKSGAPKPIPDEPPPVETLPPTAREGWRDPPELTEVKARFAAGEYRACVEPIEALFFARRNTLHQGLLQYVVGIMQARRGLTTGPRTLLAGALDLWSPYPDWQAGVDLAAARRFAREVMARIERGESTATVEPPPL